MLFSLFCKVIFASMRLINLNGNLQNLVVRKSKENHLSTIARVHQYICTCSLIHSILRIKKVVM